MLKDKGYKAIEEEWQVDDIKAIFEVNGVRVGIGSLSDPDSEMEPNMEAFVEDDCSIIVSACRMKSDTYHKVVAYLGEEQDYDIIWYDHFVYQVSGAEEVQEAFNEAYAEQVVKLIKDRISGRF